MPAVAALRHIGSGHGHFVSNGAAFDKRTLSIVSGCD
jgi:hypothetical protein